MGPPVDNLRRGGGGGRHSRGPRADSHHRAEKVPLMRSAQAEFGVAAKNPPIYPTKRTFV